MGPEPIVINGGIRGPYTMAGNKWVAVFFHPYKRTLLITVALGPSCTFSWDMLGHTFSPFLPTRCSGRPTLLWFMQVQGGMGACCSRVDVSFGVVDIH